MTPTEIIAAARAKVDATRHGDEWEWFPSHGTGISARDRGTSAFVRLFGPEVVGALLDVLAAHCEGCLAEDAAEYPCLSCRALALLSTRLAPEEDRP